jgi:hypothetical protein
MKRGIKMLKKYTVRIFFTSGKDISLEMGGKSEEEVIKRVQSDGWLSNDNGTYRTQVNINNITHFTVMQND